MPKAKTKSKAKTPPDPLLVELAALSAVIQHGFQKIADAIERSQQAASPFSDPAQDEPDTPDEAA